ncbi:potassium-transporting ATPase subunit C [Streptomyces coeruleorubidus]|uniref:Potassium-transporting ATPase KdpC subunit n=1 Tax=Streptomyces coeruleorubidus TaxID=116188 RepID=A0A5J6IEN1_STRC4|nr:potassium-transporting ATPase subunit C [Streptomyces coeruleorubidus]QEV29664.1 potassium-transporting ATPase subunit C [Streptomyces coeruleorubidus]GGT98847.1 potassium-transporting ATPase KdpC subunit [Streptomyces coeruleorubidus]
MNSSVVNTARLLGAGLRALLVLTLVTGVIYPLVVTGIAQGLFPGRANGSEIRADGKVVGSSLIGQQGYSLDYFQPRPANGLGENSVNTQYKLILSGATNLSADNQELVKSVEEAKARVLKDNSTPDHKVKPSQVPADAVTSSGSGLDPDISPAYADLQVHRVAERNGLTVAQVRKLVYDHTEGRTLGFIGEPRVNVLELNIALRALVAKG